jgi:acyl transferase domain-containing protein
VPPSPSEIAIIGVGALFPRAQTAETFWENIISRVDAITEVPRDRWDWRLYYDENQAAPDRIYAKRGGFLDDVPFDPIRYGIPPVYLKSIEPLQLLALEGVRRALADAGYEEREFDRENTSVILGSALSQGDLGMGYMIRAELPQIVGSLPPGAGDRLPEWTEASFAGYLLNVMAGRVANRFNLGGTNQTIEAACASSLAAVKVAVDELAMGRSNMAISGGIDATQNAFSYLSFCKTQALSPSGVPRAFDKNADGTVLSEGAGIIILKRLADARKDGDRVYAVIKGVGGSSDGKALSLYAPNPKGQMRAFRRAYDQAGFEPATLDLIEAHGTSTAAGDQAEVETVITTLSEGNTAPRSCAVGSIKNQIGHTKGAAGIASLIKATLALHHKTLPPHINVKTPLDPIADARSPVYLLNEATPWVVHPDHPRRAGVSSFGFGGTNFHVALEEDGAAKNTEPAGAAAWPCELLLFRAADRESMAREITALIEALASGAEPRLRDLAFTCSQRAAERQAMPVCLSAVVRNVKQLALTLKEALPHVEGRPERPLWPHVRFEADRVVADRGTAFLVPGLGSQYVGMARNTALYFPELREALGEADGILAGRFPQRLSRYIFPPDAYSEKEKKVQQESFEDTHVTVSALYAVQCGFADLARRLGIRPAMALGHSFGEPMALHLAGGIERDEFLRLGEERSRIMAEFAAVNPGAMGAVNLPFEEVERRLADSPAVVAGNRNAPGQTAISGPRDAVIDALNKLRAEGVKVHLIPGDCAFHSPLFEPLLGPLTDLFARAAVSAPGEMALFANNTGGPFPTDAAGIRERLARHLIDPVEFVGGIEEMYKGGARVFVELGPKSVLTNLVNENLNGRDYTAVSLDGEGGGLQGFLKGLAILAARGVPFDAPALFDGRDVRVLDLDRLAETTRPDPLPPAAWYVNGGSARPKNQEKGHTGRLPRFDADTNPGNGPDHDPGP